MVTSFFALLLVKFIFEACELRDLQFVWVRLVQLLWI